MCVVVVMDDGSLVVKLCEGFCLNMYVYMYVCERICVWLWLWMMDLWS